MTSLLLATLTNSQLTKSALIMMFIFGFFCLFLSGFVIFLYVKKIMREKEHQKIFGVTETRNTYLVFAFWNHVVYLIIIFAALVGAIVLLGVAFGSL